MAGLRLARTSKQRCVVIPRRRISPQLRRLLAIEAGNVCSYCRSPAVVGVPMAVDHIIPLASGGDNEPSNLCLACYRCNEFKGIQTEGDDPLMDVRVPLFHPKTQRWMDHFAWSEDGHYVLGLTSTGRATIQALQMNDQVLRQARAIWVLVGVHPPIE